MKNTKVADNTLTLSIPLDVFTCGYDLDAECHGCNLWPQRIFFFFFFIIRLSVLGDDNECQLRALCLANLTHVSTHTQIVTWLGKSSTHSNLSNSFFQYLHLLFLSKTQWILYGWKGHFFLYDKIYLNFISIKSFWAAGRNVGKIIKLLVISNFISIFIMFFHLLGRVSLLKAFNLIFCHKNEAKRSSLS